MRVALRLFAEQGFHRTTVRHIAKECGITDAAIYYHFNSKRAILESLYEDAGFKNARSRVERPIPAGSLVEHFTAAAEVTAGLYVKNADLLRVILMGALMGDPSATALQWEMREMWRAAIHRVLERYAQENKTAIRDASLATESLIHLLVGAFVERVAISPRGRARSLAAGDFKRHLAAVMGDLAATWEGQQEGPLRFPREMRQSRVDGDLTPTT